MTEYDSIEGVPTLYEKGPCLVVNKPSGLLTQAPVGIDSLEGRMSVPGFYDDSEAANQVVKTHEDLKAKLKALYQEWEELAQKATAFS